MLTPTETTVLARIDGLADELIVFLQQLVRIPTVNPPGANYADCAQLIGNKLREFGYATQYVTAEGLPECTPQHPRVNVIGRLNGLAAWPTLHFNGHLDVVPPGAGWTVEPFAAVIRDGRIYGRGVTDQKAGIAASIFAVEAIRRAGINLHGAVEQSATVDEESGGFAGVAYLAQHGIFRREALDYVIITEPLDYDRICLGHRGVYWFEVVMHGRTAHGSMPFLGVSAIEQMARFIAQLERELKPALVQRQTRMPVEPPGARAATLNVNAIHGGQSLDTPQTPCVADLCRAIFDRRFLLEENLAEVRTEIHAVLADLQRHDADLRYELNDLMIVHPTMTAPDSHLVATMATAIQSALGKTPPLIASPGTYDQKHFARLAGVEQCIAYGPGLLNLAHQPDEYCEIEHLIQACKAMALATLRLLNA
ncbi:MAG: acetylornithine deacetylase/succinyl-diaminopimelate desuccinylase family protein [Acidobacteria bacterium]|nr:acetylornithine deacetylase/succinyl-diaminopimelate desuccinylase family protein [Acidobacteriota bacterium]MBI3423394.1 acetylornithine deacetylase/succinyl-diaminopimelate desuccinylase family protein [Acidobacteriota bacterium]